MTSHRRKTNRWLRRSIPSYLVLSTPTILFSALLLYVVGWNFYLSFTNWSLLNPKIGFAGLTSYVQVVHQSYFINSLIHSSVLAVVLVAVGNGLGILLAGLLFFINSSRLRTVYLSIIIYPLAISMAINSVVWLWLYNYRLGVNWILTRVGLPAVPWLFSRSLAFPSIIIITIWAYTGLATLFYLASYINMDKSVIEAAMIDRAGPLKILRSILVPNSLNSFIVSTALLLIFSLRIFTVPYVVSGGPTNTLLQTLVVYMYYLFTTEYFSQSAAVASIITLIAVAIVIPYALIGIRRWIRT
jgi:glucose/arabinose transport system permease protein